VARQRLWLSSTAPGTSAARRKPDRRAFHLPRLLRISNQARSGRASIASSGSGTRGRSDCCSHRSMTRAVATPLVVSRMRRRGVGSGHCAGQGATTRIVCGTRQLLPPDMRQPTRRGSDSRQRKNTRKPIGLRQQTKVSCAVNPDRGTTRSA